MRVWRDPEGRGPYGIAATPSGDIYYVSLAGSHLARVDRETGAATIIEPPTAGQGARRVWADSSGNLWISEWNGGQLSRYTPSTGEWRSWRPEGERPRVYAVYVDDRDIVWITDFGANATLSFDPATERWTRYPGSGDNANVRQILGRPGWVYLPESGLDRIMVVRTGGLVKALRCGRGCGVGGAGRAAAAAGDGAGERPIGECFACHALEPGRNTPAGPTLHGIVGRPVAADAGFNYSPALRRFAARQPALDAGSCSTASSPIPKRSCPGTEMGFVGMRDRGQRRALIAWLAAPRRRN